MKKYIVACFDHYEIYLQEYFASDINDLCKQLEPNMPLEEEQKPIEWFLYDRLQDWDTDPAWYSAKELLADGTLGPDELSNT